MRGLSFSWSLRQSAAHSSDLLLLLCVYSLAVFASGCAAAFPSKDSPAVLTITPAAVDFKTVVVGEKNSQTITVANVSTTAVDLKTVHVSGLGFQLASA